MNAKDMITVVYGAFLAHKAAYSMGYLHRDISDKNIMMKKNKDGTVSGVLSDWDLAVRTKDENGKFIKRNRRQRYRTGTWYFISARLLQKPDDLHTLQDDLESFLHLVLFFSLKKLEPDKYTAHFIIGRIFADHAYHPTQRTYFGGEGKLCMIVSGTHVTGRTFQDNGALVSWILAMREVFSKYYFEPDKGFTEPYDQTSRRSESFDTEVLTKAFEDALNSPSWSSVACLKYPSDREGPTLKTKGKSKVGEGDEEVFANPGTSQPNVPLVSGSGGPRRSGRNKGKPPRA